MDTQIVKWGNGQGIRIPKIIMKQCGFFSHKASISFEEIQNISDAIQGIFDYYSYE